MKIVLTGASGFVGRLLVPILSARGSTLLLVGRDPERLKALFPSHVAIEYSAIEEECAGADLLVHLAVLNNNTSASSEEFAAANVDFPLQVAGMATRARISCFVNICSTHALNENAEDPYASSKREGAKRLRGLSGISVTNLFLPAVYDDGAWSGNLAILNRLPSALANMLFPMAAALKPTLHVQRLADYLLNLPRDDEGEDQVLADGQSTNLVYRVWTRMVDLAGAALIVILLWWLLLILWAAVRLQSPGPGIFAQVRVGRNGRTFMCYKFRTMQVGTKQAATNLVSAHAVTGLGRILRRTKLDELPQVWNIFRNEMGFIGPRPCLPNQTELIEERRMRGVLALKPGISGLGQVEGIDMSEPVRLARVDQRYGALQSIIMDLKLMIDTIRGKGQGDRVAKAVS